MPRIFMNRTLALAALMLVQPSPASAQAASEAGTLASWVALNAPSGHEHLATNPLLILAMALATP